ncbi:MAG: GDSL-type esterase/lipase family protein [Kiritimatiellia bacterium]|jgi:lysophospholipase L1-like esterase|nr:GDSL-type esterase/lipase family protein [Kiritimatiellia bacterium]
MKRMMRPFILAALTAGTLWAQTLSTTPTSRGEGWEKRVARDAALAKQGGWELVFLGDSITDFWQNRGKAVWEKHFSQYKALNLGISADRTEHVLWRLDHGVLDGYQPKLFVVMIGTNNNGHRKPELESTADTVAGIKAILGRLVQKAPHSRVLLLAIFPRGATAQDACRLRNEAVNAQIQKFADNKRVFWMNLNDKLLQPDGTLSKEVMPDLLHPNEKGYAIWAEAIAPFVTQTLRASVAPVSRMHESWWKTRFGQKQALVKQGGWQVVFVGDSITHGWEGAGKAVWEQHIAPYQALNLGYGGDRTEHVLWRLGNGELDGYQPKLLVLMIGTNNTGHRPEVQERPEDTAAGIKAILEKIAKKSPATRVVLMPIFPRSPKPTDRARVRNDQINALIRPYADGQRVTLLDINPNLLEPDGTLAKEMMPDFLHPKEKGYTVWAEALKPILKSTFGK